jgi:adenylate cyclase class 2
MKDTEIEVKFFISNLEAIEARLIELNAVCRQPRTHEINLRFDTPDHSLSAAGRVLRLRHDLESRLTYKGPGQIDEGTHSRQEIEFVVGDYQAARKFLELLGYDVVVIYEKFRAVYELDGVNITLDELPYGNFIEIEGPTPQSVHSTSQVLRLNWEARNLESYIVIFYRLRENRALTMRDLIFDNFTNLHISIHDLGVIPADT